MTDPTCYAAGGMVATADRRATVAAIDVLQAGGCAVDGAVAAAAVMAVTSPQACGMGGDLFALISEGPGEPLALNASGRAGSGADPKPLRQAGLTSPPFQGDIRSVTVPGCVDGWLTLHERFGRLPLAQVLHRAHSLAADGFAQCPPLAAELALCNPRSLPAELREVWGKPTALVRRPGVARSLQKLVRGGRDAFYLGEFGQGLQRLAPQLFAPADLARVQANWVTPLRVTAWGHELWTIPPNSQGYIALLAAGILDRLGLPADPQDSLWAHLVAEAVLAASHDRPELLHEGMDAQSLIDAEIGPRSGQIDPEVSSNRRLRPMIGATTHLCVIDADRMGVSLIQSNGASFGSGVFEPATGIELHNRGMGFSLQAGASSEYLPGRRPPHTLSPALITRPDGSLRAVLGAAGGDAQPAVVTQLAARLLHGGMTPGQALDAPRLRITVADSNGFNTWAPPQPIEVFIEQEAGPSWSAGLVQRGHTVKVLSRAESSVGCGHIAEVMGDTLAGAAEPREPWAAAAGC